MSGKHHRYTEIIVVLSSLFVISGVISFLHGIKQETITTQTHIDTETGEQSLLPPPPLLQPQDMTDQTTTLVLDNINSLKKYISPLIAANNIQQIAEIMKNNPVESVAIQAEQLIEDKENLLRHESKVQLVLALALNYDSLQERSALFNIFLINKQHFIDSSNMPILFVAASPLYAQIIPTLLAWAKNNETVYAGLHKKIIDNALYYTIAKNNVDKFDLMVQNGVPVSSTMANELLWRVVTQNKSTLFIPLLKKCGADLEMVHSKKTVLIQAIMNDNKEMVQALLNAGARIDTIPDPATGSPLQQALLGKHTAIELLLRKHGAKE